MSAQEHSIASEGVRLPRFRPRMANARDYGIVFCFVGLFIALSATSDAFLTTTNLLNILDQWAPTGIIAVAMTLVLIAGGFDISVGSTYALSGVVAALLMRHTGPAAAILAGVTVGFACGLVNGVVTTVGRINTFIATLATGIIFGGAATLLTEGKLITVENPGFATLGTEKFLELKYSVWLLLAFAIACGFVLTQTTAGRAIYAAGGNPEAARLSGIRVNLVKGATFAISGLAAGVAGVLVASRVVTGQADAGGLDLTFDALTAVVIGGTSILGGAGAVWRTVLGLMLLAMIANGFNLLGVDPMYQKVFTGAIILAAVGVDALARKPVA
jgi:ribose transport system permease protein